MKRLKIGLYGTCGHQLRLEDVEGVPCEITAVCGDFGDKWPGAARFGSLDDMLRDSDAELISICSDRRADQPGDALLCIDAGRHVYAEKPCAMDETTLDLLVSRASERGVVFHEMAGSCFEQPYFAMRELVESGAIGDVIEVFAQKSYPFHSGRPVDENADGGLLLQVGVHAFRFVEQISGLKILRADAIETKCGGPSANPACGGIISDNPAEDGEKSDGLRMAVAFTLGLERGAIGSVICNYCNPQKFGSWGNEHVRVFGTKGMLESVDAGARTRLVTNERDFGAIDLPPVEPYFSRIVREILSGDRPPLSPEDELHPTRMLIRARERAVEWSRENA